MTMVINGDGFITGLSAGGLPDAAVTQSDLASGVAGTGPAFMAWKSTTQGITADVYTKITFDTEDFDTNNNFASSTFTPTVAGYYQVNASVDIYPSSGSLSQASAAIYKNGTNIKYNQHYLTTIEFNASASSVIYMNGTTDYLEVYARATGTSPQVWGHALRVTTFSGSLVRAA